jgi:hypothetical protein
MREREREQRRKEESGGKFLASPTQPPLFIEFRNSSVGSHPSKVLLPEKLKQIP